MDLRREEQSQQRMVIFIVSLDSKTIPVTLPPSATVRNLRDKFDPTLQHSGRACKCTLIFQGVKLKGTKSRLSSFGVTDGSVLQAMVTSINLRIPSSPFAPVEGRHRYWRCIRDNVCIKAERYSKGPVTRRLRLGDTVCEASLVRTRTRVWLKIFDKEQQRARHHHQWVELWCSQSLELNFQPLQPPGTSEHDLLQAVLSSYQAREDSAVESQSGSESSAAAASHTTEPADDGQSSGNECKYPEARFQSCCSLESAFARPFLFLTNSTAEALT